METNRSHEDDGGDRHEREPATPPDREAARPLADDPLMRPASAPPPPAAGPPPPVTPPPAPAGGPDAASQSPDTPFAPPPADDDA